MEHRRHSTRTARSMPGRRRTARRRPAASGPGRTAQVEQERQREDHHRGDDERPEGRATRGIAGMPDPGLEGWDTPRSGGIAPRRDGPSRRRRTAAGARPGWLAGRARRRPTATGRLTVVISRRPARRCAVAGGAAPRSLAGSPVGLERAVEVVELRIIGRGRAGLVQPARAGQAGRRRLGRPLRHRRRPLPRAGRARPRTGTVVDRRRRGSSEPATQAGGAAQSRLWRPSLRQSRPARLRRPRRPAARWSSVGPAPDDPAASRTGEAGQLVSIGIGNDLRPGRLAPRPVLEGWAGSEARRQAEGLLVGEGSRRGADLRVAAVAVVRSVGAGIAVVLEGDEGTGERTGWGWLRHPGMIPPAKPDGRRGSV